MEGKRKLAIANDIQAGLSFDAIQKKHHACYGTVKSVAEEFGLEPHRTRRNALSDLEKRAIMDYYEQGRSTSWIAKEMGLKYDTVRNYKPGSARGAKKGTVPGVVENEKTPQNELDEIKSVYEALTMMLAATAKNLYEALDFAADETRRAAELLQAHLDSEEETK